jgi:hypothetical protein
LTVTVLLQHLEEILSTDLPRARVLHIQYDNCWRDNKNKFILAFAGNLSNEWSNNNYTALLVNWNLYDEVHLSCLVAGHTHEDVDQMFSSFYKRYYSSSLYSLHEIDEWIKRAYPSSLTRFKFFYYYLTILGQRLRCYPNFGISQHGYNLI